MLKAILFDMDGTLTRPHIDWAGLRQRLGVPPGVPIMDHLDSLESPRWEEANALLEAVEMEAATQAVLNPGAVELVARLRGCGLQVGLITNNHRRAMQVVVEKFGLDFDLLLCREDGRLKPAPDLLVLALERFQCAPAAARFVVDGRYDRAASQAAGIPYLHLAHDPQAQMDGPTVHSLDQVWEHLRREGLLDIDTRRRHPYPS